jgi:AcrR family transcriptional regulator
MARRSDHTRDELKILILDAAWYIVRQEGHEALTARRIASEIGYTPGTVYNLFESMDDLILHINLKTFGLLYQTMNNPSCHDPENSPLENAKIMADRYMAFTKEYKPYWIMMFTHRVRQEVFEKENTIHQNAINGLFHLLENLLRPLLGDDEIRLRSMARCLWASVHGLCFLQETGKLLLVEQETSAQKMMHDLLDTFFNGLKH